MKIKINKYLYQLLLLSLSYFFISCGESSVSMEGGEPAIEGLESTTDTQGQLPFTIGPSEIGEIPLEGEGIKVTLWKTYPNPIMMNPKS